MIIAAAVPPALLHTHCPTAHTAILYSRPTQSALNVVSHERYSRPDQLDTVRANSRGFRGGGRSARQQAMHKRSGCTPKQDKPHCPLQLHNAARPVAGRLRSFTANVHVLVKHTRATTTCARGHVLPSQLAAFSIHSSQANNKRLSL